MTTRLTKRAAREIEKAQARWREKRPAAPNLLLEEIHEAFKQIRTAPHSGQMYGECEGMLARRVLCEKTEYHVYYVIDDVGPRVVSIWGSRRGSGPRLSRSPLS